MAEYKVVDTTQLDADLTSVADAIRIKSGTTENLEFPQGFVNGIGAIESGGGGSGDTEKIEQIIDESGVLGTTDETVTVTEKVEQLIDYANFKNIIQERLYQNERNPSLFLGSSVTDVSMFDYSKTTSLAYMFTKSKIENLEIDISAATSLASMCAYCNALKTVKLENAIPENIDRAFISCEQLESVELLDMSKCTVTTKAFDLCYNLKTIRFESETIKVSVSFANSSLLSAESISGEQGIINGLNSEVTGQTLTIPRNAVKKAFETSEGANDGDTSETWNALVASKPNWTITLS